MTPPKSADRKRKLNSSGSPVESKAIFPILSPTSLSPHKKVKLSPSSSSPSKKKLNLVLQQGASQNNKILRYLQPKRLLPVFDSQSEVLTNNNNEDKENKSLELKVSLVRLEDDISRNEHSYCVAHRSPKKFCCNAASEYVTRALENIIISSIQDPCERLGIAVPPCIVSEVCQHEELVEVSSSHRDNLLLTMIDADLIIAMIRACSQHLSAKVYPSPSLIHAVFQIMKETSNKEAISLAKSYLKKVLRLFPPCCPTLRKYYLNILHSSDVKILTQPSWFWSLRSLDFVEERLNELETHLESMLKPDQLKQRTILPGIRKIVKPRRFRDSPSPVKRSSRRKSEIHDASAASFSSEDIEVIVNGLSSEASQKRQARLESLRSMTNEEKTDHIFSRFDILVDILESDLVLWLSKNADNTKISDRTVCPLVVLALWKPESDTGFDSINCRRIFSMYAFGWVLKLYPRYLKTLSRLIALIAEITSASEPNSKNLHPHTGDCCDNLSRKLSDALKNPALSESRAKAVKMLKPDWLQMQVSANLLGILPSISSVVRKQAPH